MKADLRASGERVDALLQSLAAPLPPAQTKAKAEELASVLTRLYGAGFARVLQIVDEAGGERAARIFERLCEDDLVASLMVLHGLHPLSLEERLQRALDTVRPYIKSHQGKVEFLRTEGETVYLRFAGSCHGCPSSAATLKLAIERAIFDACPEITEVRAEGAQSDGVSTNGPSTLRVVSDWLTLENIPEIESTGRAALDVQGASVLLLRLGSELYAYRNQCPSCLHGLSAARLDAGCLTCAACGASFDIVRAGRATGGDRAHLEPYPLVADGDRIQLAIPVPA